MPAVPQGVELMAKKSGVFGAKELQRAFRELAHAARRPVAEASRHAMQPILKAARANTSHASIKKALVLKQGKAPKDRIVYAVGGDPKNPDYRLLHLQEFGVDPHKIGEIDHPGHAAQPFLTPAFHAEGRNAIKRFGERLGPALEKQAARIARKRGSGT